MRPERTQQFMQVDQANVASVGFSYRGLFASIRVGQLYFELYTDKNDQAFMAQTS